MTTDWEHNPRTPRQLPVEYRPLRKYRTSAHSRARPMLAAGITLVVLIAAGLACLPHL